MSEQLKSEVNKYNSKGLDYWLKPENLEKMQLWAQEGLIMEQLAKNMGIATSTLYKWRTEHSEINEAWLKGKLAADMQVVNAVFRSALGHTLKEVKQELNEYGDMVVTEVKEKEVSPNTTSQAMWLKNRMPDLFKDNQLTEHYREKVKAETDRIKAQTELIELQKKVLQGDVKDTGHLAAIAALFKSGE